MLNLQLRDEFKGERLKGTTIDFSADKATSALQRPTAEFLAITYPSVDLLKVFEATQPDKSRPVVLLTDTLDSPSFAPHPATDELVDWLARHGGTQEIKFAAQRARTIYRDWLSKTENKNKAEEQMKLFDLEWKDTAMIQTEAQLQQAIEQIENLCGAVEALRKDIFPQNPRNFAILAEGPVDEIRKLQAAIDDYLSRLEAAPATAAT